MKTYSRAVVLFIFFFLFPSIASAQSEYVLPYPAAMPGSMWYKLDRLQEYVDAFWYYGDFGKFTYNLKEADKYLVEAKVLFEYKQYLLANRALLKSNDYFKQIRPNLTHAHAVGKDIHEKEEVLQSAARKHEEVLQVIEAITPESFVWVPEKQPPTVLNLKKLIQQSIRIRRQENTKPIA